MYLALPPSASTFQFFPKGEGAYEPLVKVTSLGPRPTKTLRFNHELTGHIPPQHLATTPTRLCHMTVGHSRTTEQTLRSSALKILKTTGVTKTDTTEV